MSKCRSIPYAFFCHSVPFEQQRQALDCLLKSFHRNIQIVECQSVVANLCLMLYEESGIYYKGCIKSCVVVNVERYFASQLRVTVIEGEPPSAKEMSCRTSDSQYGSHEPDDHEG